MKKKWNLTIIIVFLIIILFLNPIQAGTLKVTNEHPFLINNNWIDAKDLVVGDLIKTIDGKLARITNIKDVSLNKPISVYNLEASIYHDFIVSDDNLIVHNSNLYNPYAYRSYRNIYVRPIEEVLKMSDKARMREASRVFGKKYINSPSNYRDPESGKILTNWEVMKKAHDMYTGRPDALKENFQFLAENLKPRRGEEFAIIEARECYSRGITGKLRPIDYFLDTYSDDCLLKSMFDDLRMGQETYLGWQTKLDEFAVGESLGDYQLFVHAIEPAYFNTKAVRALPDNPNLCFSAITNPKHSTAGPMGVVLEVPPELIIFGSPKDIGSGCCTDSKISAYRFLLDRLKERYFEKGILGKKLLPSPKTIMEKTKPNELNEIVATVDEDITSPIRTKIKGLLINQEPGELNFREGKIFRKRMLDMGEELNVPVIEIFPGGEAKVIQTAN